MKCYTFSSGTPRKGIQVSRSGFGPGAKPGIKIGERCIFDGESHLSKFIAIDKKFPPVQDKDGWVNDVYVRRVRTWDESSFQVLSRPDSRFKDLDNRRALILVDTYVPRSHKLSGEVYVSEGSSEIIVEGVRFVNERLHQQALVFLDTSLDNSQEFEFVTSDGRCYVASAVAKSNGEIGLELASVKRSDLRFTSVDQPIEMGKIITL